MANKLYLVISGFVFLMVAVFHALRLVYQWPIIVGPRTIPYALSFVGCPVSFGYFVWAMWLVFKRSRPLSSAPSR